MKKLLTIFLMLLGAVAQAQNFAITATTEAAIRKNIVKGNAANYGFGMINDTLKLVGLTTRNVIFTGSTSKTDIGLGNVDNTSDANKPVSTATQTALNLKANIASPTFTGTVSGITKSMVGLGNVDNTTDAAKTISTATQTALDAKQATLNGTGFVKSTAGTISYDNSTFLTTSTAASTYLPISNPTATGTLTAPTISNTLGANFATTSGSVGIGTTPSYKLHVNGGNIYVGGTGGGVRIEDRSLSSRSFQLYVDGGAFVFYNHNNSTQPLTVTDGGNILVGTVTNSGYKLDVNGNIRATTGYLLDGATNKVLSIQTDLSNRAFFGGWQNGAYMTSNRNPADGVFTDVAKAAAIIAVTGGTSDSNIEFRTTSTNNTLPGVRMYINKDGNVGIGTTTPAASAILDITSTTQGVLFPRMTTTQINAIASPANGLTVYNTTLLAICFYDGTGWKKVSHSSM